MCCDYEILQFADFELMVFRYIEKMPAKVALHWVYC